MIGFDVKKMFFDSSAVMRKVDPVKRRVFGKFGGKVRTAAKSLIQTRLKGSSSPGQPPYDHVGARIQKANRRRKKAGLKKIKPGFKGLKHILFGWDQATESVVIGPASNQKRSMTIPEILEEGKAGTAARPFMGPAFEETKPKLDDLWANSIK